MLKRRIGTAIFFLLIFVSLFVFSSCGGGKPSSELSMAYLTETEYFNADYSNKPNDGITVGINEKSYIVMDYRLTNLKKVKKKKGDKILTAEFDITCHASDKAQFDFKIEDFPTNKYTFSEEKEYKTYRANIEMHDGVEDELNYRFIVSVAKPIAAEINVAAEVSFWYNSDELSEGCGSECSARANGKITVDGSILPESKLDYELSADGSYYYVIGTGEELGDSVKVPEKYRELPVKAVADNAFINVNSVKEIILHEGIEKIGASAFKGCTGVENFIIPSSVTEIGDNAFADCTEAMIWCVAASKPVGWSESWKNDGAPVIWNSGEFFTKDSGKTTYTFTFIDDRFSYEKLSVPETYLGGFVTAINGNGVHDAVSPVKSLIIPKTVSSIGEYAFHNLAELTEIRFNAAECGSLNSEKPSFSGAGKNTDGITVIFGNTVKTVPINLFSVRSYLQEEGISAPNIKSVAIGNSVEKVGSSAFEGCTSLTSASIASGVIGNGVFKDCSSLTDVTLGDDVTKISNTAFRNCTALRSIVIGKNVTSIGNYAFAGCSALESVRFTGIGTWYVTQNTSDSDSSLGLQMNVNDASANALALRDTYHDKHWFKV